MVSSELTMCLVCGRSQTNVLGMLNKLEAVLFVPTKKLTNQVVHKNPRDLHFKSY